MKPFKRKNAYLFSALIIVFILANAALGIASYSVSGKMIAILQSIGLQNLTEFRLRKIAHVLEYILLGFILAVCFKSKQHPWLDAVAAAVFVAMLDETIQMFSPARHALLTDVWLDIASAAIGAIACAVLHSIQAGI